MSIDPKSQDSRELHATCDRITVILGELAAILWKFNRVIAEDLGLPLGWIVRDKKEQPPVAAVSKEFIYDIPDPRLRQVYRRRMCATDSRTDWRS